MFPLYMAIRYSEMDLINCMKVTKYPKHKISNISDSQLNIKAFSRTSSRCNYGENKKEHKETENNNTKLFLRSNSFDKNKNTNKSILLKEIQFSFERLYFNRRKNVNKTPIIIINFEGVIGAKSRKNIKSKFYIALRNSHYKKKRLKGLTDWEVISR